MDKEKSIIDSWQANATPWINIIGNNGIESRAVATNRAILDAVCRARPASALDIGCGEGWLSEALFDQGVTVTGIDVVPALVQEAGRRVPGHFIVASYEDIYRQTVSFPGTFDAIIINFALIGNESTALLLAALPALLDQHGTLFIQTLHPHSRKALNDYTTGWKQGSWDGLGEKFVQPYEWYFRTMEDWTELLHISGFHTVNTREVFHPGTAAPLSVIFECPVHS